jgi:aspartate ammonia-lyase
MRIEHDALGDMELSDDVYYGIQAARATENCDISGLILDDYPDYVNSVAIIKKAAALANKEIGALAPEKADAIAQAVDEIVAGKMKGNFPINIFRGGGGTPLNMNVNEVIANRANELLTGKKGSDAVHPNTHVNMGQSTNDVIPTAMKLLVYKQIEKLVKVIPVLEDALLAKIEEFKDVIKLGRTCMNDAVPMTLGQEFSGYYELIKRNRISLETAKAGWAKGILGATAVGTGMGVMPGYIEAVYKHLSNIFGTEVKKDKNFFDGMQNSDGFIVISGQLKTLASAVAKIAIDLRILASGPRAGFGEITIPAVQPGSSIMPGKINPVMPELIIQILQQITGNDVAVSVACSMNELEINPWEPVMIKNIMESFELLTKGIPLFTEKCIKGIEANAEKSFEDAEISTSLATMISALLGYKEGSKIAKTANAKGQSVKQVAIEEKVLTLEEAEEIFDLKTLTDIDKMQELLKKFSYLRKI